MMMAVFLRACVRVGVCVHLVVADLHSSAHASASANWVLAVFLYYIYRTGIGVI